VMHDLLGGGVVRAVRVGHGDRVEPVVDQVLAVGADLVDLGLVVGGGLEVGVVERVAFEVLAVVGHRGELGPGDGAIRADEPGDDVERAVYAARAQRLLEGDAVLVLDAVVEGQRHDRGEAYGLRVRLLGVAGQVGGEEGDGGVLLQRERPGVDGAGGGGRRAVGGVVGPVHAPAAGVGGGRQCHGDRSRG